jgi:hypothetical protein
MFLVEGRGIGGRRLAQDDFEGRTPSVEDFTLSIA